MFNKTKLDNNLDLLTLANHIGIDRFSKPKPDWDIPNKNSSSSTVQTLLYLHPNMSSGFSAFL